MSDKLVAASVETYREALKVEISYTKADLFYFAVLLFDYYESLLSEDKQSRVSPTILVVPDDRA